MSKQRAYTRRLLQRNRQKKELERRSNKVYVDYSFAREHTEEMRRMLKGVDLDRWYD